MPKISVIIPVYKVEKYLAECIVSVLAQDFTDFELILVNDGSPDRCDLICHQFADQDNRIVYIEQDNTGVSVARNNGLKHAKGDYVYFMDSDDTISENFLSSFYNKAIETDADIVILSKNEKILPELAVTMTAGAFIKHKLLLDHPDIRFPAGIQPCEDGIFSHCLLCTTKKLAINPLAKYNYRQYPEQNHRSIEKNCDKVFQQIPHWFDFLNKFYEKNHLFETHAKKYTDFIAQEPFLRLINMPFNRQNSLTLIKIIDDQLKKLKPYLTEQQWSDIRPELLFVLNNPTCFKTRCFYTIHRWMKKSLPHRLMKLIVAFIPVKKYRKKLRTLFLR